MEEQDGMLESRRRTSPRAAGSSTLSVTMSYRFPFLPGSSSVNPDRARDCRMDRGCCRSSARKAQRDSGADDAKARAVGWIARTAAASRPCRERVDGLTADPALRTLVPATRRPPVPLIDSSPCPTRGRAKEVAYVCEKETRIRCLRVRPVDSGLRDLPSDPAFFTTRQAAPS